MNNEVEKFPGELSQLRAIIADLGVWNDTSANEDDIVYRLRKRAEIRRQIPGRKSVEDGTEDRIANILEEAAEVIIRERRQTAHYVQEWSEVCNENQVLINEIEKLKKQIDVLTKSE